MARIALSAAGGAAYALLLVSFLCRSTFAFLVPSVQRNSIGTSSLFGISEWRDTMFDFPGTGDDRKLGVEQGAPPKEVCILPFPFQEVLLQGETKQLRLYEERFIELFEDCMENHSGVVGMGLLASSGIIQTVPLCEIEAYNRMDGFGIFATIRVVGRASLVELTKQEPYLKAVCTEIVDDISPNLELSNHLASNIENFMLLLSSMERQLSTASKENDEMNEEDVEMQRRIKIAQLDDRFYAESEDEGDDDESGDDDEDDTLELDRRGRFSKAYEVALATDTQGYCVSSTKKSDRTPAELTALSWSSFCTELLPESDATYRIQALDCDNLFDRLKLASHMLRDKQTVLKKKLDTAGIKYWADDNDVDTDSD
eukprot:CAMPEP_0195285906 /NCGR_PEP_ID=MMETSP0707-20130614/3571_1 /TAXON_ID=33640 /ORGANISM="Asterionellopsis glacialis, Strain CCMP134" /LENGTH=370 /DNA_ID=CAMNT_0040345477 /DNA_START=199 /DNA_END=1311 /DNA_ORIENTATION=+